MKSLWLIEKNLKKRKVKGKLQYLVKWQDFPASYNSYVDANEVKEL